MTRRKINHVAEPGSITPEKAFIENYNRDIGLAIQQIRNLVLYSGNKHILTRAELSWTMLTYEEKHEYSRRTYSLPINGFDLFLYDYVRLSGSELAGSMKALFKQLVTWH